MTNLFKFHPKLLKGSALLFPQNMKQNNKYLVIKENETKILSSKKWVWFIHISYLYLKYVVIKENDKNIKVVKSECDSYIWPIYISVALKGLAIENVTGEKFALNHSHRWTQTMSAVNVLGMIHNIFFVSVN